MIDGSRASLNQGDEDSVWLNAHQDPVASLYTFSSSISLADLNADGDFKLLVADLGAGSYDMKLKVFKGTSLFMESAIIDLPTALVTFYMDTNDPRTPAVAVASGPFIYVYKNLRPYFKFTLPPLDVNPVEQDLWNQAKDDRIDVQMLREMLESLKNEGSEGELTVRSLKFLSLPFEEVDGFASLYKMAPLKRQTVITCMNTMKKSMADDDAVSCLVIGTESKDVFVLDPEAFTVLAKMSLPSVPSFMSVTGLFDVEFRIVVACRDGKVYTLKRGSKTAKACIELTSQAVGLERIGKNIVVGCMDDTLVCYSTKGKKLWTVYLPSNIVTMALMDYKARSFKGVFVSLNNGETRIYKDKFLVNTIQTPDPVTAIRFGRFGREDSALILVTSTGGLYVKILKRTATFEGKDFTPGPPQAQSVKLNVPKKTKLFVDQTLRERESATSMHRMFQHDLYLLRLTAARSYVSALQKSLNPISSSAMEPLKLSAHIQGIGPAFKLTVNLQNISQSIAIANLLITFQYDESLYALAKPSITVPMLVPSLSYIYETLVECISDKGISDTIKVFVLRQGKSIPIITAVINMPVSEALVIV
ncbi:Bardet-Biedl syndrome 1 protein [Exaiptasia diaphana]|uniref:BBSome complex member BBS1 n=1 Tax=Exaiptasia diaphana TaxID=2652724 RepID=A0A913Y5P6_EXADI|nr:Bardet-Biedl syndrome 1 protein [Exaiptasia diaphana]KXJ22583.1 Bardet-Biedl syndrome 1 protein [Exaiptasia diaphana]